MKKRILFYFLPFILFCVLNVFSCKNQQSEAVVGEDTVHSVEVANVGTAPVEEQNARQESQNEMSDDKKAEVKEMLSKSDKTQRAVGKPMPKSFDEQEKSESPTQKSPNDQKQIEAKTEQKPSAVEEKVAIKNQESPNLNKEENKAFSHKPLDDLLSKYVSSSGQVNYKGFKSDEKQLDQYLIGLANNVPENGVSRNERLSYWINAYNAFTLKAILEKYPFKSIKDISGGKIWDKKWINLASKTYSLNDIENGIIRPQFKDARIHFAVNCGAQSCPPLSNKAFTAQNIEGLLDKNTKSFVQNKSMNDLSTDKIKISSIFDWYKADFGNVIAFLNKYSASNIPQNAKIQFMEYDWTLNGK